MAVLSHSLFAERYPEDRRPMRAIEMARAWARGEISVGATRATSVAAHAVAREVDDDSARYVARATGHAVATAHMADHAPGAAMYAIKAVQAAAEGEAIMDKARQGHDWQKQHLPEAIRELILSTFEKKFASLRL